MFKLRAKGGVEAEIRRSLESEAERRGVIEDEARTGKYMAKESLEGGTKRR